LYEYTVEITINQLINQLRIKSRKKCDFCKVITVFYLNDKEEECCKYDWEIYARNRMWFGRRIAKIQVILNPVLETKLFEIKMNNLQMQ
jgi:hypothetical protein